MTLLTKAYREGWIKERKLHLIYRAIARRHLLRCAELAREAEHAWAAYESASDQMNL